MSKKTNIPLIRVHIPCQNKVPALHANPWRSTIARSRALRVAPVVCARCVSAWKTKSAAVGVRGNRVPTPRDAPCLPPSGGGCSPTKRRARASLRALPNRRSTSRCVSSRWSIPSCAGSASSRAPATTRPPKSSWSFAPSALQRRRRRVRRLVLCP